MNLPEFTIELIKEHKKIVKRRQRRAVRSVNDFLKTYLPNQYDRMMKESDYQELIKTIKETIA